MTGRTNGTTPNFFATMTIRPPTIVDRPHRHVSAAINYYFHGRGYSRVDGNRYEWKAGDLMVSAPGWAVHNHASYDDYRSTSSPCRTSRSTSSWSRCCGRKT